MEVEVVTPIVAEAEVQKYTLISDDIYVRRYTSTTVPDWYRNLIENLVAQDPTITDIQGAIDYLTSVDNGYAVQLVNLENQQSSTNALLTTLQSSNSNHTALIADLQVTKVDEASAQAIATNAVQSYIAGGSANAWFTSQVSTYASEIEANASSISTMSASIDGLSVSIDDISYVSIDPITGYKLGASKLGTAPDGSITGWQFADGTGVQSTFKIMADNFQVSNGTTGYTPFSISGSNVLFNGVVDFTNTNIANGYEGTTTINGGLVTAGTVTANQISANAINGFMIEGTYIKGAYIEGSVIKSSWIDYSSSGELTNWKYYTPSTIPSGYEANFAHNNSGSLIVDIDGYVRLQGLRTLYSVVGTYSATTSGTSATLIGTGVYDNISSFNEYKTSNPRRMVNNLVYIENQQFDLLICSQGNMASYTTHINIMGNDIMITASNPSGEDVNHISVYKDNTLIGSTSITGSYPDPYSETSISFTIECFTFVVMISGYSHGLRVRSNARTYTFTTSLEFDAFFKDATISTSDPARPASGTITIPQIMIQSQ